MHGWYIEVHGWWNTLLMFNYIYPSPWSVLLCAFVVGPSERRSFGRYTEHRQQYSVRNTTAQDQGGWAHVVPKQLATRGRDV